MSNPPKKSLPRPGRKPKTEAEPPRGSSEPAGRPQAEPDVSASAANSRQIAILAARAGLEKKATGIEIIDVMGKVDYADYLVLMTGASDRNVAAIAHEVDAELAKAGYRSMAIEGLPAAQWVLIDFVDVVVHVFQRDVRSLYDLDGLWMDAARVPVEVSAGSASTASPSFDEAVSPTRKPRATKKAKAATAVRPRVSAARKTPVKRTAKAPRKVGSTRSAKSASKAPRKSRPKSNG
jgi:ribosome-associated protein